MLGMPKKPALGNISQGKSDRASSGQDALQHEVQALKQQVTALQSIIRKGLKMSEADFQRLLQAELETVQAHAAPELIDCPSCGRAMRYDLPACQFCGAKNQG